MTGSYVGNGANVRNVSLGFNPRIVIVFANALPLTGYDDGKVLAYAAIATTLYCSAGISLIENGMTVVQNLGNPVSDNNYVCLNKTSCRYMFIAIK